MIAPTGLSAALRLSPEAAIEATAVDKSIDDPHDNVYHPSVEFWKNFSKPPDESTFEDWIAAERDARTRYFENLKVSPSPPLYPSIGGLMPLIGNGPPGPPLSEFVTINKGDD